MGQFGGQTVVKGGWRWDHQPNLGQRTQKYYLGADQNRLQFSYLLASCTVWRSSKLFEKMYVVLLQIYLLPQFTLFHEISHDLGSGTLF